MIRFGRAKHFDDVTIDDCIRYPIWTSAHDERHNEEMEKPIVSSKEVTQEIVNHPLIVPIITLRVRDTDLLGVGSYLHSDRKLFAIAVWHDDRWRALADTDFLTLPVTFVSVPKILGDENVEFRCSDLQDEDALRAG